MGATTMAQRVRQERPLTEQEARFAEEHMGIIYWYLGKRQLPYEEWFDVVVLRYLETVKRWHEEPDLRARYSFTTIAVGAMRSAISNEVRAQGRQPRTVGLYDTIPGTNGLTWAEVM